MHKTEGLDNVGNMFDPGDPLAPRFGTELDYRWANAVQKELTDAIEGAGVVLRTRSADVAAGYGGQLLHAIQSLIATAVAPRALQADLVAAAPKAHGIISVTTNAIGTPISAALIGASRNIASVTVDGSTQVLVRVPVSTGIGSGDVTAVASRCESPGGDVGPNQAVDLMCRPTTTSDGGSNRNVRFKLRGAAASAETYYYAIAVFS